MVTATAAAAPAPAPQGHCSRCGKVWTLAEAQGTCQWCGKPSTCQQRQGSSRTIKTRRKRQQAATGGNGLDQLEGRYATYNKVASRFNRKAKVEDTQDLLHDIILTLARAEQRKPLTEAAMYRTASHVKDHYWYELRKRTSGLDCQHCSKAQRHKCKGDWLYGDCPKAIKLESLNKPIIDSEGNLTELGDLIADDKALDLDKWLDYKTFILGAQPQLKRIAYKLKWGIPLEHKDREYLRRFRKREQKSLF